MVNVNNLRRKRNAAGTTSASLGAERSAFQVVEEIVNERSLTVSAETVRREIRSYFKTSTDGGIEQADAFKVSLIDPISKLRIRIPVRSTECDHFQCFDLYHFLEFSFKNNGEENKNAWVCPHCQAEAKQEQLRIDGYFQEILLKVGPEPMEVELLPDGNWREVEQLDFKEVLLNSIDDDETVPKKKAKIHDDNIIGEASQLSNSSLFSANNEYTRILNMLRELLRDDNIVEAVQNLIQKVETMEKNAPQPKPTAESISQTESLQNFRENASQTETISSTNVIGDLHGVLGIKPGKDVLQAIWNLKLNAEAFKANYSYALKELRKIVGENEPSLIEAVRKLKERVDEKEGSGLNDSREIACETEKSCPNRAEKQLLAAAEKSPDETNVNLSDDVDLVSADDDDWEEKLSDEEFFESGQEQFDDEEGEMDEESFVDEKEESEETGEEVLNEASPDSPTHNIPLPTELPKSPQQLTNVAVEVDSRPASTNKESPIETQPKSEFPKISQRQNPMLPNAIAKENSKKIETGNHLGPAILVSRGRGAESFPISARIEYTAEEVGGHLACESGDYITARYEVMEILGEGKFTKVLRVKDHERTSRVDFALKVFNNTATESHEVARREIEVLNLLEKKDPGGKRPIVQLFANFDFQKHKCLVFELLGPSVCNFMRENNSEPFPMEHTRKISYQLIQAVKFLHDNKLIHIDLKPENILFVNGAYDLVPHEGGGQSLKILRDPSIRLIGFDSVLFFENKCLRKIPALSYYCAPEFFLALKWAQPCNVWSIGCIMFELYTGKVLFPTRDKNEHLAMVEKVLGKIPHRFEWDMAANATDVLENCQSLNRYKKSDGIEEDRDFFSLLRELLDYEMDSRIGLGEAMKHPYFNCLVRELKKRESVAYLVRQMNKSLNDNMILYSLRLSLIGDATPECPYSFLRREQGRGTELVNFLHEKLAIRCSLNQLGFEDFCIFIRYRTKAEADKIHEYFHEKIWYGLTFTVSRRIEQNEQLKKRWQSLHAFKFLAQCPQFQKIRQLVQQDLAVLHEIIEQIAKTNPELLAQIRSRQEEFSALLGTQQPENAAAAMKLDK